mgnify:CR=1 FL=1
MIAPSQGPGGAVGDTISLTYVVSLNSPPVIAFAKSTPVIFQCSPEQVCIDYTATDVDNNVVLEEMLSSAGTIDTAANQICFTPAATGVYTFIVRAQDACSVEDRDTIVVTVTF